MIFLVVPTIRESNINKFLELWKAELTDLYNPITTIIVEDNPEKTFNIKADQINYYHYSWKEIDEDLKEKSWIISRRDSAIRCYGFYKAWQMGAKFIVTLDDDCYPLEEGYFFENHIKSLETAHKWVSSIAELRVRGIPYLNLGKLDNVMLNMGLWSNFPDQDSIQMLANPITNYNPPQYSKIIPKGQYFPLCFLPEELVGMTDGTTKFIKDIKIGENVITDNGETHEVLNVFESFIKEKTIQEIKICGRNNPIRCTPNHEILTLDGWKKACDLSSQDYLSVPRIKKTELIYSDDEMYALGLFLAEGSYRKSKGCYNGIIFSININEMETIGEFLRSFFSNKFGKKIYIGKYSKSKKGIRIGVCGEEIVKWFYDNCGEYSNNKKINPILVNSKNINFLLKGLFKGDGCWGYNKGTYYCKLKTTSIFIANQIKFILNNLGFYCSISNGSNIKRKQSHHKAYNVQLFGNSNALKFINDILTEDFSNYNGKGKSYANNYKIDENYVYQKVISNKCSLYTGTVYNLHIHENHTYTINNCVVKNCGMNLMFKREITQLMYFPLMGLNNPYRRFDDIFCGIILKKICDHLNYYISVGKPVVKHIKASNPMDNLIKEAPGIKMNETFWEEIDKINLTEKLPERCMVEIGDKLKSLRDKNDYLYKLGEAMMVWGDLYEIS